MNCETASVARDEGAGLERDRGQGDGGERRGDGHLVAEGDSGSVVDVRFGVARLKLTVPRGQGATLLEFAAARDPRLDCPRWWVGGIKGGNLRLRPRRIQQAEPLEAVDCVGAAKAEAVVDNVARGTTDVPKEDLCPQVGHLKGEKAKSGFEINGEQSGSDAIASLGRVMRHGRGVDDGGRRGELVYGGEAHSALVE